ncbi:MAG: hypothetical protein ACRDD6_12665 [Tannerellaceae bacterium]
MIHPTVMLRKSSLKGVYYSFDYPAAEDYKLWIDLALNGLRFANIPDVLLKYRVSDSQVSQAHKQDMINSMQKIRLEYFKIVVKKIQTNNQSYMKLIDPFFKAVPDQLISFECLRLIVSQVYCEMLNRIH